MFLGVRKIDKIRNEFIRNACGVEKGINESILRWFGYVESMDDRRMVKKMYKGERSVGRGKRIWIDSVKECLMEKNVSLDQARRLACDRSDWRRFVRGRICGTQGPGDEPRI